MPRSLRGGIDVLSGYRILDSQDPLPPPQDDYYEHALSTPLHFAEGYSISTITIWGTGLITFGLATEAQRTFMANLGTSTDLSGFPGDYVALGFSAEQYVQIEAIIFSFPQFDFWVQTPGGRLVITDEGLVVTDLGNDNQTGWSMGSSPAHSGGGTFYWSDLAVTDGTGGDDMMNGSAFAETLRGLGGNDTLLAGAGADALDGGDGNDELFGGEGLDRMWGGDGDDILHAGSEFRLADGGAGFDRLVIDHSGSANSLVLDGGQLLARPDVIGIEAVDIVGTDHVDVISGTAESDSLFGGGSFDLLIGGDGDDYLDAGPAGPSTVGALPDGGMTIADALSLDHLFTTGANGGTVSTTVTYIPELVESPSGAEVYAFTVSEAGARLWLNFEFVPGSAGSGGGYDFLVVDANGVEVTRPDFNEAVPYVFPEAGTYYLTASLSSGTSWDYGYLHLDLTLEGAAVLTANRMIGGNGDDTYVVHAASDQVIEEANQGFDTVRSHIGYQLGDHLENLTLVGTAAINGTGNDLSNVLTGNSAGNHLSGGAGFDWLTGGDGADQLTGGTGFDLFSFTVDEIGTTRSGEHDFIADFTLRQDKIDLSALYAGLNFGGLRAGKASDAAKLSGYKALTFTEGGSTWLVGDTDGQAGADFAIELSGLIKLKATDVIVFPLATALATSIDEKQQSPEGVRLTFDHLMNVEGPADWFTAATFHQDII